MEGTTEPSEHDLLQTYSFLTPSRAPMPCSLSCSEPSCAKPGFIPTISTPTCCMHWEPTSWRAEGIPEVPVAYFILDTALALSDTLSWPGSGGAPPLGCNISDFRGP